MTTEPLMHDVFAFALGSMAVCPNAGQAYVATPEDPLVHSLLPNIQSA